MTTYKASLQMRLELAAVRHRVKPLARLVVQAESAKDVRDMVVSQGLAYYETGLSLQPVTEILGGSLVRTVDGDRQQGAVEILYVVPRGCEERADDLREMETGSASDEAIGVALGYPKCCTIAYRHHVTAPDWLSSVLANSEGRGPVLAACNRLARLFGDWAILPDYIPCSFMCESSGDLAERVSEAGRADGFGPEIEATWVELCRPIRISGRELLRCSIPPQFVELGFEYPAPRVLVWSRKGS